MTNNHWLNKTEYPFESKYAHLTSGKIHYIDEGTGDTILFVHGTPSWSFVYRNAIKELKKSYRCVAPDHLGFGLSQKPQDFSYKPEDHAKNLTEFIHQLKLKNITLIVHDIGGPVGLSYAVNHPENVKRIVVMNSWFWSLKDDKRIVLASKLFGGWLGRFLYLKYNFSPKILLKKGFYDKSKLTKEIHNHYLRVFPDPQSRISLWTIVKELLGSSDWYDSLWQKKSAIQDIPALILWGMRDQLISNDKLDKWKELFSNPEIVELNDSGHFVQEECPEELVKRIAMPRSVVS